MTQYLKEIVLDFSGSASGQRIVAKQGDKKSRFLKISPILNGQQLVVDNDCSIDLRCVKPDKTTVRAKGTQGSDGKITVELPEQALAVIGDVKSDIAIIGNQGEILSSSEFIIEVRGTPDTEGYIPSEDYFKRESDIDMNNHQLKNLSAPQDAHDAATKEYIDSELKSKLSNADGSVKSNHLSEGCVSWRHIGEGQVTTPAIADNSIDWRKIVNRGITEEKLSTEVAKKLNSGIKQINKITLDETTQGAQSIKITQDNFGNTFSLSNAVITAHLNIDISNISGNSYQIRIVANKGRFLFFKSGLAARSYADVVVNSAYDENTGMTFNVGTHVWSDSPNISTGSTSAANYPSLCNTPDGDAPIEEVEVMVIDLGNNQRLPLLSGSFLNIKGE